MNNYKTMRDVVQKEIDDPMTGKVGIYAFDLSKHQEIINHAGEENFLIASITKIFTVGAAFEYLGGETTFCTRIVATAPTQKDGTLDGDLYIVGGGDPTLGDSAHVKNLYNGRGTRVEKIVEEINRAGIKQVTGQLIGDGSFFEQIDKNRTNWITALSFNRTRAKQPVLEATQAIMQALRSAGVSINKGASEGSAPASGTEIGTIESPTVQELAVVAGHESDNFVSEVLTKQIASVTADHGKGNTMDGCTMIERHAAELGARVNLLNGSGIKQIRREELKGNTATPRAVVNYLRSVVDHKNRHRLEETLPRAAAEGTLKTRMRNTPAAGSVYAKTGTLTLEKKPLQDSLAGYCVGGSATIAFAVIYEKAESRFVARVSIDRIMDSFARYCA